MLAASRKMGVEQMHRMALSVGSLCIAMLGSPALAQTDPRPQTLMRQSLMLPNGDSMDVQLKREGDRASVLIVYRSKARPIKSCSGTCYYNGTPQSINWTCPDNQNCLLHCTVDPLRGECY